MKKLSILFLVLIIISCKNEKTLDSSLIEVELGLFHEKNKTTPFNGYITHEKDSVFRLKFKVSEGLKNGPEIITKFNGDTLQYSIYDKNTRVFHEAFNDSGIKVYTLDYRNKKINISNNKIDLFKQNILANKSYYLDTNTKHLLRVNFGTSFWKKAFNLMNVTYGSLEKIKTISREYYLTKTNDTLQKTEYEIQYSNAEIPLKLESVNDSLTSFKFSPIYKDFIPRNKYLPVYRKIKNLEIDKLFDEISGDQNNSENVKLFEKQLKQMGKIIEEKELEFLNHYINLINNEPVLTSEYLLKIEKKNIIQKNRLLISYKLTNGKYKLYQFYIYPLRFPLKFE